MCVHLQSHTIARLIEHLDLQPPNPHPPYQIVGMPGTSDPRYPYPHPLYYIVGMPGTMDHANMLASDALSDPDEPATFTFTFLDPVEALSEGASPASAGIATRESHVLTLTVQRDLPFTAQLVMECSLENGCDAM